MWGQCVSTGHFCNRFATIWLFSIMHAEDCCGVRSESVGGQGSSIKFEDGRVTPDTTHSVQSIKQGGDLDAARVRRLTSKDTTKSGACHGAKQQNVMLYSSV